MITRKDIEEARNLVQPYIHRTPLVYSSSLSEMTGADIYVKAENLQKTGSFKVRGAFNKMIRVGKGKVVAASMGNHAQAVAFAAQQLGSPARIIMPKTVSIVKEEATRRYGAEVELYGETFQESLDYAISLKDYTFIHAFDDPLIIAGQGTIGLEVIEGLDHVDAILVPVGGGGLMAGITVAVKETNRGVFIAGVQAKSAPSAYTSFNQGSIASVVPHHTIADGIAVGKVGEKTFEIIKQYADDMVTVEEDSIAMAILLFMERSKFVVEGAGAVPLAAVLENKDRFRGKRVVLVASGGNIDLTLIDRMIYKGLLTSGRIAVFEVIVDDVPGMLQALTAIVARHRGNILNVVHDRLQADLPIGKTRVIFIIETRTRGHLEEILCDIEGNGYQVKTRS